MYIRQLVFGDLADPNLATERKVLQPLEQLRGIKDFKLWYRHERSRDPLGGDIEELYTYDVRGELCEDRQAEEYRESLSKQVRLPRGTNRSPDDAKS